MSGRALTGELLALAALAMFSANVILTKVASGRLNVSAGFLISIAVNAVFAALLLCVQLALRPDALHWDWPGFALFVAAGALSTYVGRWFMFESIVRLGPARASLFQVSSPLFAALIAWVFLGERLGLPALAAMALTLGGLVVVGLKPSAVARSAWPVEPPVEVVGVRDAVASRTAGALHLLLRSGFLLGAGSAAAYGAGYVLRGAAIRQWDEAVLGALVGALAAIALQALFGKKVLQTARDLRHADRGAVACYAVGGVLTISAQICVIGAMAHIPVALVALITLCTPLLVFPISYFVLKNAEGIGLRTLGGGALALLGIALILVR